MTLFHTRAEGLRIQYGGSYGRQQLGLETSLIGVEETRCARNRRKPGIYGKRKAKVEAVQVCTNPIEWSWSRASPVARLKR